MPNIIEESSVISYSCCYKVSRRGGGVRLTVDPAETTERRTPYSKYDKPGSKPSIRGVVVVEGRDFLLRLWRAVLFDGLHVRGGSIGARHDCFNQDKSRVLYV